ncbi:MAG: cytochrome c biogenesis protein CcdA [Hyphomicrobiales bacterium]|nr:cytochrome c biogenesis protein CcdA [Hyphomicrobiales bacterium]
MEFDASYAGSFVAGIVSFLSPCVLPLVPPYLAYMAGVSLGEMTDQERPAAMSKRVVLTSIIFVLGFATVFVALGASFSFIGSYVTAHYQTLSIIAGLVIIGFGLHFLGIFKVGFLYREARFQVANKQLGLIGAYLMGLAFAFGWTPCVGPVLTAILFVAGNEADATRGALLLLAYALGIGIPFIVAAVFASQFMRFMGRFRAHMGKVEKVMGVMLIGTGILFLTGGMQTISFFLLEKLPGIAGNG